MRPEALGSRGRASLKDEGPVTVKLEDSEREGEAVAWDPGPEAARQRFRRFRYEEVAGPGEALARLRELCRQWLRPEAHSKEQMLELLVLEQFLGALPSEIQARVRGQQPGSPEEAAALVEGLRREPEGPRRWVSQRLGVSASSWGRPAQQDASPPRSASGHLQQTLWQGSRGSDASPPSAGVRTQAGLVGEVGSVSRRAQLQGVPALLVGLWGPWVLRARVSTPGIPRGRRPGSSLPELLIGGTCPGHSPGARSGGALGEDGAPPLPGPPPTHT